MRYCLSFRKIICCLYNLHLESFHDFWTFTQLYQHLLCELWTIGISSLWPGKVLWLVIRVWSRPSLKIFPDIRWCCSGYWGFAVVLQDTPSGPGTYGLAREIGMNDGTVADGDNGLWNSGVALEECWVKKLDPDWRVRKAPPSKWWLHWYLSEEGQGHGSGRRHSLCRDPGEWNELEFEL